MAKIYFLRMYVGLYQRAGALKAFLCYLATLVIEKVLFLSLFLPFSFATSFCDPVVVGRSPLHMLYTKLRPGGR
jgi:hypothetical protein